MAYETTFALVKPGPVQRGQVGRILTRYEDAGLEFDVLRFSGAMTKDFWTVFYGDLDKRIPEEAYENHIRYMCSGPVVPMLIIGTDAIARVRMLNGPTNPLTAPPGTIRGDFGRILPDNAVHASDSEEAATREFEAWRPFLEQ